MPKPSLSKATVLDVRGKYRLVDRTDDGPELHVFCVEQNTGDGWALLQPHQDKGAASAHFDSVSLGNV